MQRVCYLIHLTLFWPGVMSAVTLVPQNQARSVSVGESVTLRCSMKGESISNYYTFWYRKTPGNTMTLIYREGGTYGPGFEDNFQGEIDFLNNQAVLNILEASERDEGSYYCASTTTLLEGGIELRAKEGKRRTVYYPLLFGKGTYLNVEPKIQAVANPSVFVMKNGTYVTCLVKEFYPKDVTISLESSKIIREYDPAIVISPGGRYSAVKLGQYGDPDSVTCSVQHNKQTWRSTDFKPKKNTSENPKPKEPENVNQTQTPETCYEPQVQAGKVNMMSLAVLGLRMLFAKSVAINFLLTAKLFFF
ncbi:T cell receptor alpha chain MC.7.G5-like [Orcinus orca]|uniref:T cell receptor alpha chain MC.7.G5-like n=1 Tax=Orcinus orca TaxID=9733 RepID=UPI00062B5D12|nr:T cell receptor alpha chain MC.7.G5-like [Orcinus orca]